MNKIKSDKINFNNDDFLVNLNINDFAKNKPVAYTEPELTEEKGEAEQDKEELQRQQIIINAQKQAQKIIQEAQLKADEVIKDAQNKAQEIEQASKKEASDLLLNSQNELEQIKIQATRDGYAEGHKDGVQKAQEELEEKIEDFSKFCSINLEIKEKILKSASKDILDIIENISGKILYKEINADVLDKIIQNTVSKLEKKEDITIIVSEKYAKMLFELQNKSLEGDIEFNFSDFKQYKGFNIIYNPSYSDDTIIVENLKERFDSSIKSQIDIIIRDIYEQTKNAQFELDDYIKQEAPKDETDSAQ